MSAATLTAESRFFRIRGGETVVEALPSGSWIRWDRWDGPVGTSIWKLDSPELVELTEEAARILIRTPR